MKSFLTSYLKQPHLNKQPDLDLLEMVTVDGMIKKQVSLQQRQKKVD